MKAYLLLLFVFGGCISSVAQQEVTISQCYHWAEQNYPQIRQYGLIDQAEQYNLSNAGKSWLPQLNISAKASYQSEVTKLPIDVSKLPVDLSIPSLSKDQYQVAAELSQTLWDGGVSGSAKALTKTEAEASRKQLQSELYTLKDRVNQLYFGCLLQEDLLQQNQLLQNELQVNLDRIEALMTNGMANESDRELLEVELLNVRQRETELKASKTAYLRMLSYFTGVDNTDEWVLEKPTLIVGNPSLEIKRPELEAFQAQLLYTESQNKAITASLMPRIGAFVQAGYGRPGLNMLEDEFNPFYIAGVRMSWNLGRLYTVGNDRRKVDVARNRIDINKETFLFNTKMQLINQNEEIQKITRLMQSDDEIIRLRNNVKKAAEMKLKNGVISVSDLIREINAEDIARQTATIHHTQRLMAVYQLMYITNNE
ncbi:TolC family protein [Massilibacteroides sp.]|uniref:TolC family protein n=1 Tax=Massilibacteroides sp. TaxID=2034766 RepID=UPI0026334F75|nr:TolC family protein [Massilibacteroides sp.]MDD4516073.1 TolC family protein [Massilibacteroides sp.]